VKIRRKKGCMWKTLRWHVGFVGLVGTTECDCCCQLLPWIASKTGHVCLSFWLSEI
jgi:hypothetical protein